MKQQEILRKIGNILKELNEQYDYLQAEDTHLNDLELELFAANAKFLTDHTEILRKINAQTRNILPALPEHTDHANTDFVHTPADLQILTPSPEAEISLPAFSESAMSFNTEILPQEIINLPASSQDTDDLSYSAGNESEQVATSAEPFEAYSEELPVDDQLYHLSQQSQEESLPEIHEDEIHEPASANDVVQDDAFTPTQPAPAEEDTQPEPGISIGTAENDRYDFIRHEPQISGSDHTFSISSHTEEPTPPHVDLTPVAEQTPEETTFTPEVYSPAQSEYAEPVYIAPTEPEPILQLPTQEAKPHYTSETVEQVSEKTQYTPPAYTSPATESPKSEPEQPLTLNQRLSAQLHPQTPAHIQQGPVVSDIKAAISMNDKLLFVKDLFNGYGMAYTEAIELVNRCKTFDEADRFLKSNYVVKNSWGDKPNTVDKFYAVLHRRFPE